MEIADLLTDVLGRIEESNPPVFWSLQNEVYPQMVDAMFESSLISGVVQAHGKSIHLPKETTFFFYRDNAAIFSEVKGQIIAPIRMRGPYQISKTTLNALDSMNPGWQKEDPSDHISAWFPLGTSGFGIYPQLSSDAYVTMDFIVSPASQARPYSSSMDIPFQAEFSSLLSKFGAAMLRSKEGGSEAEESDVAYQEYLSAVKSLTMFQNRVDSLVYSMASGARSLVNPKTIE